MKMSIHAVETGNQQKMKQWLTYWVTFVTIEGIEQLLNLVLPFKQLVTIAKMVFFVYLTFFADDEIYQQIFSYVMEKQIEGGE